jgi:hypothetical protein
VTPNATATATVRAPVRAGTATGFTIDSYGGMVNGPNVSAARKTTGAAAATQAHQRQRADGSDPVGVSSRTKPMHTSPMYRVAGL